MTSEGLSTDDFIDLKPGWRLRVVTPLGKTGSDYRLKYREVSASGNSIILSTDEFQGYELSYYAVERRGRGMRVGLASASIVREGYSAPVPRSVVPLFAMPARTRFVRLMYLARITAADHNMAVIACQQPEELTQLTLAVKADPAACGQDARCKWVPAGIAVRPEHQSISNAEWQSVR